MKFIPNYTVSYKGVFHRAGKAFEIDAKDRAEMERHGVVEKAPEPVKPTVKDEEPKQPVRKGGRPRKVSE